MKRLNGMDAILLYSEAPNVHAHTLKVAIVDNADGRFTLEVFREAVAQRLHLLEPLSYKLIDIPGRVHHPMWLQNCPVDLGYHIRASRVKRTGERADLDKTIGEIASTPLDRNYPRWEFYYTEGLAERKVALIGKIHHALADGVASADLLARLMDNMDAPLDHHPTPDTCTPPSSRELLAVATRDHLHQIARLPSVLKQTTAGVWRLRRRRDQHTQSAEPASLLQAPESFFNHVLSSTRTFASALLPLKDVKQTVKNLNITVNDMVLAMAAGALRTLVTCYDHRADHPLVASVPTSTESSPDRISGNELGGIQVSLPVHIGDPLERVRHTALATRLAKGDRQLLGPALSGQLRQADDDQLFVDYPGALSASDAHTADRHREVSVVPETAIIVQALEWIRHERAALKERQ